MCVAVSSQVEHTLAFRTLPAHMAASTPYARYDEQDRRFFRRVAGLRAVHRSQDYITVIVGVAMGELTQHGIPVAPDPEEQIPKREWESNMQSYRRQLRECVERLPLICHNDAVATSGG